MHHTTRKFWEYYRGLPQSICEIADKNYELLKADPSHPSLHFKKVGMYWSVRVGSTHRALGIEGDDGIVWFWIGTHSEYERRLNKS